MKRLLAVWIMLLIFLGEALLLPSSTAQTGALVDMESLELDAKDPKRPLRAALFRAPGFPTVDVAEISDAVLKQALAGLPVDTLASVAELNEQLRLRRYDALILPYGSAFPLDAWIVIRAFIKRGGSLVVLGGAPLHQPVRGGTGKSDEYVLGVRQSTFAHEFLIGPAERWSRQQAATSLQASSPRSQGEFRTVSLNEFGWSLALPEAETIWELTVRLGRRRDLEQEHGSEGHRDAVLWPLAHVVDADGLPRACPLLEINRLRGSEAGGRWLLATSDALLSAQVIRALVVRALQGAVELDACPVHASLESGEVPAVRIVQRRPFVRADEAVPEFADLVVRDDAGREVYRERVILSGPPESKHGVSMIRTEGPLAPGLYHVEVMTPSSPWQPRRTTTGFWICDRELLTTAPPITVSRDWLRRGGQVFPVIGTTYMASDVHRKFLFEPNPHVWDRDFEQMAKLGINFIRTGLWTAWSRVMLNSGAVDEGFLRALDAYVLTAARHGIVVNFTFFSFLPPAFGGTHPYLDPRAIEGQRELLALVARRYRGVHWIHYDLINEPSYAPPEGLWTNQPIGDRYEERAWTEWVQKRHGDDPALLRDRWQDSGKILLELPRTEELYYTAIREDRRPRKLRDFVHFSQDVVTGWARTLRSILRAAGGEVLVTLGQDEGGTWQRSSQQLHAESIDYTGIHPWWRNDEILATGVLTKVPEKPNLFQETGIMRLEDLDGWPWRSPELAAQVLERKYIYAFGARAAGAIEWAWNINPYQPIDNESVIGLWRPDGTTKPELRVIPGLARFFAEAAPYLDDFEPDPVVAIIPHSRLFMSRPGGVDGLRRIIRVLAERFGVVPTALSELRLTAERLQDARLILVPTPLVLDKQAAQALLQASRSGAKVLVTGVVLGDPYGELPPALRELGVVDAGRPVRLRETTPWGAGDKGEVWATYDRDLREQIRRSVKPPLSSLEGSVWHEPLPLEFAREEEPLAALLGAALEIAGVKTQPSETRVMARLLYAPQAILVVVVNETAADARRRLTVEGQIVEVPVAAGRGRLVLFERGTGRVLATTAGDPVSLGLKPSETFRYIFIPRG